MGERLDSIDNSDKLLFAVAIIAFAQKNILKELVPKDPETLDALYTLALQKTKQGKKVSYVGSLIPNNSKCYRKNWFLKSIHKVTRNYLLFTLTKQ